MSKINFAAKHDYEYLNNYKVLQETFKRNKIDKVRMPLTPWPLCHSPTHVFPSNSQFP